MGSMLSSPESKAACFGVVGLVVGSGSIALALTSKGQGSKFLGKESVGLMATLCSISFCFGFAGQELKREREKLKLTETCELLAAQTTPVVPRNLSMDVATKEGFLQLFEELCVELQQDTVRYGLTTDATKHLKRLMEYNVPGGKLNRGLTVVHTAQRIRGADNIPFEEKRKIAVLGWCIEWVQASFLVADDMMDSSVTRRGQPCWYKNPDIGVVALNDTLILLTQVEILLRRYYGSSVYFMPLHACLTETIYQTELGQLLDLTTQPPTGKVNLELYTEERYNLIVKFKTAFYSFYCPVVLGLIACGIHDKESLDIARSLCIKMGTYFQIQDDYLDCYGTPEVIGKIGTDIQDSKCGWLVVQALKRATKAQKKVIQDNYGKDDEACIQRVKELYKEMKLEEQFKAYEEESYKILVKEIAAVKGCRIPNVIFSDLLKKIYKRSK